MWSHYACSHSGLVLQFKKNKEGFLTKYLLPVNYFDKYPIINVSDYKQDQIISVLAQILCAKSKEWKYENELRCIFKPGNQSYKFDRSDLTGVIFGLETTDDNKKEVYDLVNSSGYNNVIFKQAEFEFDSFKVIYKEYKA